jgi:hypothetical protein
MTKDEILNMPAGRVMDALVAEKIMEQMDFSHIGFFWSEGTTFDGKDGWSGFQCPRCNAERGDREKCVEHYSTNIFDAWEVVEKFVSNNYSIPQIYRMDEDDYWHVALRVAGDQGFIDAEANTVSLAICRAGLLAMEIFESYKS